MIRHYLLVVFFATFGLINCFYIDTNGKSDHHSDLNGLSTISPRRVKPACKKPEQFDELRLATQWIPGVCLMKKQTPNSNPKNCTFNTNEFTIHGLWPSNVKGSQPENCCTDNLEREQIQHLYFRLQVIIFMIKLFSFN